tara:strand:- start:390 stop:668 length:279 start_codon:yes stop_codon:yes gene_type:complete
MNNVYKKSKILDWYAHGCEYTFWDNTLMTRHDESEDWGEVMLEHCMSEGENHYEVFKYFGKENLYVDILFTEFQNVFKSWNKLFDEKHKFRG